MRRNPCGTLASADLAARAMSGRFQATPYATGGRMDGTRLCRRLAREQNQTHQCTSRREP